MSDAATELNWLSHFDKWINRALQLDQETLDRLADLEGKVIAFEFRNTEMTLYLLPHSRGVMFKKCFAKKADILIKGTPLNFFSMMIADKTKQNVMSAEMELFGDIGLAQRFQFIMQDMDLDFEEPLSKWFGDTAAYQLGRFFRHSRQFVLNTSKILADDVSEYLRFENEMLPDDLLVKEFNDGVDKLREDLDRLTLRLQKLEAKANEKA